jgi:DNA polymerase-1
VHDEVLVEVPTDERDEAGELVIRLMRGAADLNVPLEVNAAWAAPGPTPSRDGDLMTS